MSPTPNIILFGGSGSGKSSIINMIAEHSVAVVSSSVHGCTFQSTRYMVNIMGKAFNLYDTAGLDEGDAGTVPKNDAVIQLFRLLKNVDTGVNLLVFCMRGPRIKDAAYKNWRLFHEIICRHQVPIVMAITGLEQEEVMDEWWVRNKGAFQQYGMHPQGVACITAIRGKHSGRGGYIFDDEYEESKEKMRRLFRAHHLENPWKMQPVEWFSTIVNVTYSSGSCGRTKEHRTVETVVGPGIRQLVEHCEMTEEEAKQLGGRPAHNSTNSNRAPETFCGSPILFYGYDIGTEWYIEYTITHRKELKDFDDLAKISAEIQLSRAHTRIKGLMFESALNDPTTPTGTVTIPGSRPGEPRVPVLSIFSNEGPSYNRRPSQEQVDKLAQIIGRQPRWWIDYDDSRQYEYE